MNVFIQEKRDFVPFAFNQQLFFRYSKVSALYYFAELIDWLWINRHQITRGFELILCTHFEVTYKLLSHRIYELIFFIEVVIKFIGEHIVIWLLCFLKRQMVSWHIKVFLIMLLIVFIVLSLAFDLLSKKEIWIELCFGYLISKFVTKKFQNYKFIFSWFVIFFKISVFWR